MQAFGPYRVFSKAHALATVILFTLISNMAYATNYIVTTKADLQNRMNAALPGDTVIVANGTYNWGQIIFTNNNGAPASSWIVLKAQAFKGVKFTGSTYLQFKGTRVAVDGFVFAEGNAGANAVISFRSSSSSLASHCRISNIIIDNYNTPSIDSSLENEWVGIYGTNNRVDHCTFINKYNARATVVVWYANTTYPNPAPSTFHRIDSNYFLGRSYMGDNGGETIRVGTSTSSRTDGFNIVEYNLFENCTQVEPEIISGKSDFNTYRYNTFRNCAGGITLRHGRYSDVYSNFFIVDDPAVTQAYGIRVIDKGHRIFNNYLEGVNGNSGGGSSQLRAPINLYNGLSEDSTDASAAAGYFPADSCIVAFNTIVNAKGGGGIVLGGTGGGTIQPKGIILANNLVKMSSGTALYKNSTNTTLTFSSEGNLYQAASGLGITTTGWTSSVLTFGARSFGTLIPPGIATDAAVNSAAYYSLLTTDAKSRSRTAVYDVGAEENETMTTPVTYPLDSTMVGAGKPATVVFPVRLLAFDVIALSAQVKLSWNVVEEAGVDRYEVEHSNDGFVFALVGKIAANNRSHYGFLFERSNHAKQYFRLKIIDRDGSVAYSSIKTVTPSMSLTLKVSPNPATNHLLIRSTFSGPLRVLVFGARGQQVYGQTIHGSHSINTAAWPAGTYFLNVPATGETKTFIVR
jgi:poly(beta-D-mannuronate) lyase